MRRETRVARDATGRAFSAGINKTLGRVLPRAFSEGAAHSPQATLIVNLFVYPASYKNVRDVITTHKLTFTLFPSSYLM